MSDRTEPPQHAELRDLPPSAKLVYKTLQYEGTLTFAQIAESTRLPPRTARYAIRTLEDQHVVNSRFSFMDARKRLYSLASAADQS